eukprot:TRINITY_DN8567_c0_g2_i1.p2 TRINITY_DN8567_c0_g2~~TRINITY_DN8567_c0_g2_i1.p2  ORF type:complete len:224 (+),score=85.82 TRINITY_DN8567_c0_g2_i1:3-674(+)
MSREVFTLSQAISNFEYRETERRNENVPADGERVRVRASDEEHVKLWAGGGGMMPPITKMDKEGLLGLKNCRRLALSSNSIEKIGPGLNQLSFLEVLSVSRNKIRRFENLDLPRLKQLWASYNFIDRLVGLERLTGLTTLFISNNCIDKWSEIERLEQNKHLTDVLFLNNKIHTDIDKGNDDQRKEYRIQVLIRLPNLIRIDGQPVEPEERDDAELVRSMGMR